MDILMLAKHPAHIRPWSCRADLNCQPVDYETTALQIELRQQMEHPPGHDPGTVDYKTTVLPIELWVLVGGLHRRGFIELTVKLKEQRLVALVHTEDFVGVALLLAESADCDIA